MEIKFDWDDITIVPEVLSDISSRSEINPFLNNQKLPIITAPMDMVIDQSNISEFEKNNINICLPRNVKFKNIKNVDCFYSYGLDEIIEIFNNKKPLPQHVLIDIANAHILKLYNISKQIKEKYGNDIILMVGNIANPETYRKYCEIGVDYIRVGIGSGSACLTSANVSIHYPMGSLINECYQISKEFEKPTKIVADGGFKKYSDIIKALGLGANMVMVGGIFNKALESCSDTYINISSEKEMKYNKVNLEESIRLYDEGYDLYKYFRGMSTKEVQRLWKNSKIKTSEGIVKYNKVEYTLSGWCENFIDYLRSAMSYSNSRNLDEFIGKAKWVLITQNAFNRFNK